MGKKENGEKMGRQDEKKEKGTKNEREGKRGNWGNGVFQPNKVRDTERPERGSFMIGQINIYESGDWFHDHEGHLDQIEWKCRGPDFSCTNLKS